MTDRPEFDRGYIYEEFENISDELQTPVKAYLVGGGAMSFRNLKDTTKDIDLVVTNEEECERLLGALADMGYEEVTDIGDEYDRLGARHCLRNDELCQIDLFYKQIANKLIFSDGMGSRSEELVNQSQLQVRIASLDDIFLFKAVAERPDDIDDMATLVQSGLNFDAVKAEVNKQVGLLGGEHFTTVISESLRKLDDRYGIQPPIGEFIDEHHERFIDGLELRLKLDEEEPKSVAQLTNELDIGEDELKDRIEYLGQFDVVERTSEGIFDTGKKDRFNRS